MEEQNEKLHKQAEIVETELEIEEEVTAIKNEEIKVEGKVFYYAKTILSGVVDQIMALGLALIIFWFTDIILGLLGYKIDLREEMFLIVYVVSNILYYPIIQEILKGKTLGKKIMTR